MKRKGGDGRERDGENKKYEPRQPLMTRNNHT